MAKARARKRVTWRRQSSRSSSSLFGGAVEVGRVGGEDFGESGFDVEHLTQVAGHRCVVVADQVDDAAGLPVAGLERLVEPVAEFGGIPDEGDALQEGAMVVPSWRPGTARAWGFTASAAAGGLFVAHGQGPHCSMVRSAASRMAAACARRAHTSAIAMRRVMTPTSLVWVAWFRRRSASQAHSLELDGSLGVSPRYGSKGQWGDLDPFSEAQAATTTPSRQNAEVDPAALVLGLAGITGTAWTALGSARLTTRSQAKLEEQKVRRQAYSTCAIALLNRRDTARALMASIVRDDFDSLAATAQLQDLTEQRATVMQAVGSVVIEGPETVAADAESAAQGVEEWVSWLRYWTNEEDRERLVESQVRFGRTNQHDAYERVNAFVLSCRQALHPAESGHLRRLSLLRRH